MLQHLFAVAGRITEVADAVPGPPGSVADAEFAAHEETFLGLDAHAVVAIAFLLFVLLLWRYGAFRAIGQALDKQAEKVRAELAEAAALRAEAERIRADATRTAREAEEQAQSVLRNATAEAREILDNASAEADALIRRRMEAAEERIAAEARSAEAELRARVADAAIASAEQLIRKHESELGGLTDRAIAALDQHA